MPAVQAVAPFDVVMGETYGRHTGMDAEKPSKRVRARWIVGITIIAAALMAPLFSGTAAWARPPLVVDDDGEQCSRASYETIAAALEVAVDGDLIRVCPGVYSQPLHVTKSVRIVGPVEAVGQLDCVSEDAAKVAEFADITRIAVVEPQSPAETDPPDPLVTLDADGVELAGLVIQNHVDEVAATDGTGRYSFYVPALRTTDAHSGYRIHHNAFRGNTLGVELGSNGAARTRLDHNCLRDNSWAAANQIMRLENAVIDVNTVFATTVIGLEMGWGYRATDGVTIRENTIREAGYAGITVENSTAIRVVANRLADASTFGIRIASGNRGVEILDNVIERGAAPPTVSAGIGITATSLEPDLVLPRSEDVSIRGNTVSANPSYGIVAFGGALVGQSIADNIASGNGLNGITLFNGNRDNLISGNEANDNGRYGIRVQAALSTGNLVQNNTMLGNLVADASDASDQTPADGIRLLNDWIDNDCVTDEPPGLICRDDSGR